MKLGLFMAPQWEPEADLRQGVLDIKEQVKVARQNGFASLLVGQHVVTAPMQMLQPYPLMSSVVSEAEGMLIGPGIVLLSMMSPVMVAEESATLDWLSNGNFVLAAGLGYRDEEFEVMGVKKTQRVSRFTEALSVVKRLWTEDRITHHGRHFTLNDVGASVRPMRQPRPPIWVGGDVAPAVERAAQHADAWLAAPTITLDRVLELLDVYRRARDTAGLALSPCPIIRECFLGRDTAHAREVSRGPLMYKYEAYSSWGQTDLAGSSFAESFDGFAQDRFILGDEAQVRDELQRYQDRCQTDHILVRVQWPGLAQTEVLGNIERLGNLVAKL